MPSYKLTQKSFIKGRIIDAGEVVEYDGEPGPNLVPVEGDAEAAKRKAAADGARAARVAAAKAREDQAGQAKAIAESLAPAMAAAMATAVAKALKAS